MHKAFFLNKEIVFGRVLQFEESIKNKSHFNTTGISEWKLNICK